MRGLGLGTKPTDNEISFRAGGPRAADYNPGKDPAGATLVSLAAMLACRRGKKDLPLIDPLDVTGNVTACNVPSASSVRLS